MNISLEWIACISTLVLGILAAVWKVSNIKISEKINQVLTIIKESEEFVKEVQLALDDKKVTVEELKKLVKELNDVIDSIKALLKK